jgi:hypothetical protein
MFNGSKVQAPKALNIRGKRIRLKSGIAAKSLFLDTKMAFLRPQHKA